MKFVHALNVAVVYIGMEKFGNAQTVTINANIRMYRNDHLKMYKITL